MIKAVEWLLVSTIIVSIWLSKILGVFPDIPYKHNWVNVLLDYLPIHVLLLFGLVSAIIIVYRTLTFNDCPEATTELLKQVELARSDLKKKGYQL